VSEAEENNTTQLKIGASASQDGGSASGAAGASSFLAFQPQASKVKRDLYSDGDGSKPVEKPNYMIDESMRDKNRDSMFGTMLITNGMSKEHEARMLQMQDPHLVMQQRLNDMNPMMFGDTIRLPVLKPDFREA